MVRTQQALARLQYPPAQRLGRREVTFSSQHYRQVVGQVERTWVLRPQHPLCSLQIGPVQGLRRCEVTFARKKSSDTAQRYEGSWVLTAKRLFKMRQCPPEPLLSFIRCASLSEERCKVAENLAKPILIGTGLVGTGFRLVNC